MTSGNNRRCLLGDRQQGTHAARGQGGEAERTSTIVIPRPARCDIHKAGVTRGADSASGGSKRMLVLAGSWGWSDSVCSFPPCWNECCCRTRRGCVGVGTGGSNDGGGGAGSGAGDGGDCSGSGGGGGIGDGEHSEPRHPISSASPKKMRERVLSCSKEPSAVPNHNAPSAGRNNAEVRGERAGRTRASRRSGERRKRSDEPEAQPKKAAPPTSSATPLMTSSDASSPRRTVQLVFEKACNTTPAAHVIRIVRRDDDGRVRGAQAGRGRGACLRKRLAQPQTAHAEA